MLNRMSYSISLTNSAPSDLADQVDAKIEELPDGPGKDEAHAHRDVLVEALALLTAHIDGDVTGSVSGSASSSSGSLSVYITAAPAPAPTG